MNNLTPEKIDELERQMRHLVCDECGLLVFVGEDTDPPPCCGEMRRRVPALIRAARELPEIRAEVARLREERKWHPSRLRRAWRGWSGLRGNSRAP